MAEPPIADHVKAGVDYPCYDSNRLGAEQNSGAILVVRNNPKALL